MGDESVEHYGTTNDLFFTPKAPMLIARFARIRWVIRPLIDHVDNSTWVISTCTFGLKVRSLIVLRPLYARRPSPNRALGFWRAKRSAFEHSQPQIESYTLLLKKSPGLGRRVDFRSERYGPSCFCLKTRMVELETSEKQKESYPYEECLHSLKKAMICEVAVRPSESCQTCIHFPPELSKLDGGLMFSLGPFKTDGMLQKKTDDIGTMVRDREELV